MNRLVVLDDPSTCDGVIKSVSILVNHQDDQSDNSLQELTVTLVSYRYSKDTHKSKLERNLTMESPNITVIHKPEGTVIKATINPRQERLHVEEKLHNIGVVLTGTADMGLEWNLSTQHRSYSFMVDGLDQLPLLLPAHILETQAPSVMFEIGAGGCTQRDVCISLQTRY